MTEPALSTAARTFSLPPPTSETHLVRIMGSPTEGPLGAEPMSRLAGKTVTDSAAGHALLEQRRHNQPEVGDDSPDFEL